MTLGAMEALPAAKHFGANVREGPQPTRELMGVKRMRWWLACALLTACGAQEEPEGFLPPLPDTQSCTFEGTPPGFVPEGELVPFASVDATTPVVALRTATTDSAWALTQAGVVYEIRRGAESRVVLDASALTERAYDFAQLGTELFVAFEPVGRASVLRVARFSASADAFDVTSARTVLELDTPGGGTLAPTPDGRLLVGVGDADLEGTASVAMDRVDLRGKILRLDVSDPAAVGGYAIPADNPFVDGSPSAVFALGIRSPRALTVEAGTGRMTFVDQGLAVDEIDALLPGRNYGWPRLDGRTCHIAPSDCSPFEYEGPVFLRARLVADCPMTAGAIIAGEGAFAGGLLYGDACGTGLAGFLLGGYRTQEQVVGELDAQLRAIGRGGAGGSLVVDARGEVFEVRPIPDAAPFPTMLSQAGCFADLPGLVPVDSVVPYALNAPLWTDSADKHRFIALPPGETIAVAADGSLDFPVGSVLLKVFAYGAPVETRVLVRRTDGWEAHSYRWNEEATDAHLLDASEEVMVEVDLPTGRATATHLFPDRQACAICHGFRPQSPLGPRLDQLTRRVHLPSGDADQLRAFTDIGLFGASALPELPPIADPLDESQPLEARARAYLHTNCGHCHRPDGWVPPGLTMDLRYDTPFSEMQVCNVPADFAPRPMDRLEPGDPDASRIYVRMTDDGVDRMPPLGTSLVDDAGSDVVRDFISSLTGCD